MTTTLALPQLTATQAARQAFAQAMKGLQHWSIQASHELDLAPLRSRARQRLVRACRTFMGQIHSFDSPNEPLRGPLLSAPGSNPKLTKGVQVPIWSLSLAPAAQSGHWHVCPGSTPACEAGCLGWYSGHSGMTLGDNAVRRARRARTGALMNPATQLPALIVLGHELQTAASWARYSGGRPSRKRPGFVGAGQIAVRLNAFSDIPWETAWPALFNDPLLTNVLWYDYTKLPGRRPPANYRLTMSWTPELDRMAGTWLESGRNVAMVFGVRRPQDLPRQWRGWPVLDGTASDARWADPSGHIVGLTWKASRNWASSCRAAQASGWVVDPSSSQADMPLVAA